MDCEDVARGSARKDVGIPNVEISSRTRPLLSAFSDKSVYARACKK